MYEYAISGKAGELSRTCARQPGGVFRVWKKYLAGIGKEVMIWQKRISTGET